jgi:hypothetical protein
MEKGHKFRIVLHFKIYIPPGVQFIFNESEWNCSSWRSMLKKNIIFYHPIGRIIKSRLFEPEFTFPKGVYNVNLILFSPPLRNGGTKPLVEILWQHVWSHGAHSRCPSSSEFPILTYVQIRMISKSFSSTVGMDIWTMWWPQVLAMLKADRTSKNIFENMLCIACERKNLFLLDYCLTFDYDASNRIVKYGPV